MFERFVPVERNCSTCRYSSANTPNGASQCPAGRCLPVEGLQHWELDNLHGYVPSVVRHYCDASCRHNSANNNGVTCQCVCGTDMPNWEPQPPSTFRDEPNTSCELCVYSSTRRGVPCQHYLDRVCLIDNQHHKFERFVSGGQPRHAVCLTCHHNRDGGCMNRDNVTTIPMGCPHALAIRERYVAIRKDCKTCRYNWNGNGQHQRCHPIVGLCTSHSKWSPIITPTIVEGTPESRYDIPLGVEHGTQVEQLVSLPSIEE